VMITRSMSADSGSAGSESLSTCSVLDADTYLKLTIAL